MIIKFHASAAGFWVLSDGSSTFEEKRDLATLSRAKFRPKSELFAKKIFFIKKKEFFYEKDFSYEKNFLQIIILLQKIFFMNKIFV